MAIRRQEIFCHECGNYVQFALDDELDGEHVLNCPVCRHEHYRYVDQGRITDRRWGSANRVVYTHQVSRATVTYSSSSTTDSSGYYVWGGTGSAYS